MFHFGILLMTLLSLFQSVSWGAAGGIDSVEFNRKRTAPEDFLRLAGVTGPADRLIGADEAGMFLKGIRDSISIRK